MGYQHRIIQSTCGDCKTSYIWSFQEHENVASRWRCKHCDAVNSWQLPKENPNVPSSLYIGFDKSSLFKVYAIPPESAEVSSNWAAPWSIRSFVKQASEHFQSCRFFTQRRAPVLEEPVFHDTCQPYGSSFYDEGEKCHLVSGWTLGKDTCTLWERIKRLCQNEVEQRFLHCYLSFVKDRQFPMLIPQARIGIGERRRPDFVMFVPLQQSKFRWLAIEIDGGHDETAIEKDKQRNAFLQKEGYEVFSVRPTSQRGYYEEARRLAEYVDAEMKAASTEPSRVAVEARVTDTTPSDTIPF